MGGYLLTEGIMHEWKMFALTFPCILVFIIDGL